MKIDLPQKVKQIIETLEENGFEAYAVGGCVRDSVMCRTPQDFDITTSAKPIEVKNLFRRTVDTGIQHGTVTVLLDKESFEVTTYRIDGVYEDGRHPKEVSFSNELSEDLKRRDFTINAMAYNDKNGLIDLFHGMEDLQKKKIRCVGEPKERFQEDALRIMRAFRFSAQLGFTVEEKTLDATKELAENLKKVSAERIAAELRKLIVSEYPEQLLAMAEQGITAIFFPEFDEMLQTPQRHPSHFVNVGFHTMDVIKNIKPVSDFSGRIFSKKEYEKLRFAALFHDTGKPACHSTDEKGIDHFFGHAEVSEKVASEVLHRLKMENEMIDFVKKLVFFHHDRPAAKAFLVRKEINRVGKENYPLLLELRFADLYAHKEPYRRRGIEWLHEIYDIYKGILRHGECTDLKSLAVNGQDLIAAGLQPGPSLGVTLNRLLSCVLLDPLKNNREQLIELAKSMQGGEAE